MCLPVTTESGCSPGEHTGDCETNIPFLPASAVQRSGRNCPLAPDLKL